MKVVEIKRALHDEEACQRLVLSYVVNKMRTALMEEVDESARIEWEIIARVRVLSDDEGDIIEPTTASYNDGFADGYLTAKRDAIEAIRAHRIHGYTCDGCDAVINSYEGHWSAVISDLEVPK